jgi:toxin YoeB
MLRRLNRLVRECSRAPFTGVGKPELRDDFSGWWSRRIDGEHRLTIASKVTT